MPDQTLDQSLSGIDDRLRRVEEGVIHLKTRLETELPHLATREAVAELRTEIGKVEIRLIKWLITTAVIAVLAVSAQIWGAMQLLLRLHQ